MPHVEQHHFETPHVTPLATSVTREQMEGIMPGSPDERAILENIRAAKRHQANQIGHEAIQGFRPPEDQLQYVSPDTSRNAHHAAIEHVTGEHKIPVTLY